MYIIHSLFIFVYKNYNKFCVLYETVYTAPLRSNFDGNHWNRTDVFVEPFNKSRTRDQRKEIFDYMTVLIMASLFDPLDSQAPPPCTLKSAKLAKIKSLGNTGAHKCSREALAFKWLSRHKLVTNKLALYAWPITQTGGSFSVHDRTYSRISPVFYGWNNH